MIEIKLISYMMLSRPTQLPLLTPTPNLPITHKSNRTSRNEPRRERENLPGQPRPRLREYPSSFICQILIAGFHNSVYGRVFIRHCF